jgi:hydrogenase nickel incorporation protein HypA/HybF
MHELGITQNILAIVVEAARGKRVRSVRLEVGKLAGVMPDAVAFCFEVVAQGTALEGARLQIDLVPGVARCLTCEAEFGIDLLFGMCGCGSREIAVIRGEELVIKSIDVEEGLCARPVGVGEGRR